MNMLTYAADIAPFGSVFKFEGCLKKPDYPWEHMSIRQFYWINRVWDARSWVMAFSKKELTESPQLIEDLEHCPRKLSSLATSGYKWLLNERVGKS